MPESYAYIRVSTKDQNEARQVRAMLDAGVAKDKQYIEKQSGKDFNRPVYQRLVKRMKPNDVLYVSGQQCTMIMEETKMKNSSETEQRNQKYIDVC